jgi:hypothetical protein
MTGTGRGDNTKGLEFTAFVPFLPGESDAKVERTDEKSKSGV